MENGTWLNYHHLYYFWRVAKEGSLSRAAEQLRLSHSTLSTQVRALEEHLKGELFLRSGRALTLTALGRDILQYADEIFRLGAELRELVEGVQPLSRAPLCAGVVGAIPRKTVYGFLAPALELENGAPLHLKTGRLGELLDGMACGEVHLILSDQPPPQGLPLHVFSRPVGETTVELYGEPALVERYRPSFPHSLAGAPILLPSRDSSLRRKLEQWFAEHHVSVNVMGDFDDAELLRICGEAGQALFPVCTSWMKDAVEASSCRSIGVLSGITECCYLLSPQRRAHRADVQKILGQGLERRRAMLS